MHDEGSDVSNLFFQNRSLCSETTGGGFLHLCFPSCLFGVVPCRMCPICLGELVEGDSAVVLPCSHTFHENCGSEWLLQYSKCCPVCKQEVLPGSSSGDANGKSGGSVTSDETEFSD